jgi:hypothetical protein
MMKLPYSLGQAVEWKQLCNGPETEAASQSRLTGLKL